MDKKTMEKQLKFLENEIDKLTQETIENNNFPWTIFSMFKNIQGKIKQIRKGETVYGV